MRLMWPVVTVPVLSSTIVSTWRVDSRISGPLMRMPSWAPRPVPTMRAVGVASPRAHGQAMISTATAAVNASVAPAPGSEPEAEGGDRQQDHDGDEHRGHPVGEPLDGGLAVLGVGDEPGDLGQGGVGADAGGADDDAAAGVDGGAGDVVAGGDLDRDALAGEQGGVDGRAAVLDDPVGGDLLAGADHEPVADGELVDRDPDLDVVAEHGDVLGAELEERLQRGAGAALGAGLEVAAGEDEHGDAGGDLEVDLVLAAAAFDAQVEAHAHRRVAGFADEQGVERPAERGDGADRDEGVHRRGAVTQVRPRRPVERPGAPHDHGRGEGEREPLPVVELQGGHHGQQQDRDGERRRDDQAVAEPTGRVVTLGVGVGPLVVRGFGEAGGVAGGLDLGDELGRFDVVGEGDLGLLGGVVDRGGHAVELVEATLDARGARRARHALDREVDALVGRPPRASSRCGVMVLMGGPPHRCGRDRRRVLRCWWRCRWRCRR